MKKLKEYEILVARRTAFHLTKDRHYAFVRYWDDDGTDRIVVRADNGKFFAYPPTCFEKAYK